VQNTCWWKFVQLRHKLSCF